MSKEGRSRSVPPADPATRTPPPASQAAPAPGPDLSGETFGDYRILRRLGTGGMGEVYLAEQISLGRKVALKLLREDLAAHPTALDRFKTESKTVAQLSHPNIVQVYTVGEHQGRHYMVLEYVEGKSLRRYLDRNGPLDVPLALSLMRQIASALLAASEVGIVHRDIKPENILLNKQARLKVADFGLSRCFNLDQPPDLTRPGSVVGTPLYMSPEQIEGKAVDYRSDIYSFGVTCYHMLAGQPPFRGANAFEITLKHVRDDPVPLEKVRPELPRGLCGIVRKMMAKKPHLRYQSAHEVLKDIARLRESLGEAVGSVVVSPTIEDGPATPPPKRRVPEKVPPAADTSPLPSKPVRRRRSSWAPLVLVLGGFAALAAVCVAAGVVWIVVSSMPQQAATSPAPTAPAAGGGGDTVAANKQQEREEELKKAVDLHLKNTTPNPSGVEDCIDLGVLYLEQNKVPEAEALFRRMDERKPPSSYHYVGRLGLAVTDALQNHHAESQQKLRELFDPKSLDNRAQILNDYLKKNPDFAAWVNEADSHNVRNTAGAESSLPRDFRTRFPTFPTFPTKPPFRR